MFIVNQSGDACKKAKTIHYTLEYNEETSKYLHDIYSSRISKAYNYGSTENCLKAIREEQEKFIKYNNCKQILVIHVNGTRFAAYEDINKGKEVFEKMIAELSSAEKLFRLD